MTKQSVHALAFEKKNANKRAVFSMRQDVERDLDGTWQSTREWFAVGDDVITREDIEWTGFLRKVSSSTPTIEESCEITCLQAQDKFDVSSFLNSGITKHSDRRRNFSTSYEPVTLASLPLFIAKNWNALMRGETVYASYVVLKVQRATGLKIQLDKKDQNLGFRKIEVIPTNPLINFIFGKTTLVFAPGTQPKLLKIDGLLDPRDKKHNGRWHEYLGVIEFSAPWDLSSFVE